jgi:transportin-1
MSLTDAAAVEIKSTLLKSITDENSGVRSAASTAISRSCTIACNVDEMTMFQVRNWGELVPFLLQCLHAPEGHLYAANGALVTLRKLLEDIPSTVAREAPSSSFNELTPALLNLLSSPHEEIRKEALACLNCLVDPMPGSLVSMMNDYLAGLSSLSSDPSSKVRTLVCQGIVSLLNRRSEYIQPHIGSIAEFMLRATADTDESVALEACEFWLTFASLEDQESMMECIASLFPRLLPQLLKGMVYPADKIEELIESNAYDEDGGMDKIQDLAPVFHKNRVKGTTEDSESEEEEWDDDDNEWSLRKCSAASLDALAGLYGATYTLPPLLPALQEGLSHQDPWVREASILALGAIAEGCHEELAPHLPQLHPFLLSQLESDVAQVRCIAAWTVGRYSSWVVDQMNDDRGDKTLVAKVAEALVGRLLDKNKKVQVAVCSSLGVFVESTGELMVPYLEPVYRALVESMKVYRTRSLMVMFDTLGVMADYIGPAIGKGSLPSVYVPALLQLWNNMASSNPFDRALLPLMECLGSITVACGMNFQPWALEAFENSMSMIEACNLVIAHEESLAEDDELADPIICSVDLMDGLVEALGGNFVSLVNGSSKFGQAFANVLVGLSEHDVPGVRMSLFALLGDLAKNAPSLIESGLPQLLSEAILSIDPMHSAMCNNAIWAVGELNRQSMV